MGIMSLEMPILNRTEAKQPLPRYLSKKTPIRTACYLCGATDRLTKEHVIARTFFRPDSLEHQIILSACVRCNGKKEHDEDYTYIHFIATTDTPEADRPRDRHFKKIKELTTPTILLPEQPRVKGLGLFTRMRSTMKDIDMYSSSGIYLGEGGQIPIDAKRMTSFYVDICKGLFVSALGSLVEWDDYTVKSQFDTFTYGKHWNRDVYMFPINNAQYYEAWDANLLFAGFCQTSPTGKTYSMWSIAFYNEQLATVSFVQK